MASTGGNLRAAHALLLLLRCHHALQQARARQRLLRHRGHQPRSTRSSARASPASRRIPSDMCVALAALDAKVHVDGPGGRARHRVRGFPPPARRHAASATPISSRGEIITAIELPARGFAANYSYLKIRDRLSYAFALVSVAAALETRRRPHQGGARSRSAASPTSRGAIRRRKRRCAGKPAERGSLRTRRRPAAARRQGLFGHNDFKIDLARRAIVRTLTQAAHGTPQVPVQQENRVRPAMPRIRPARRVASRRHQPPQRPAERRRARRARIRHECGSCAQAAIAATQQAQRASP